MRSMIVDLGSQPITNIAVDPCATQYNPSGGPGFGNDRWTAYESFSLVTGATDGPPGIGLATYARATCTTACAGLGFDFGSNPEANAFPDNKWTPALPGQSYTVSVWVRCSASLAARVRIRFRNSGGWLSGGDYQTNVTLTANQWQRISVTGVAPAASTWAASYAIINATMNPGDIFDATGLMIHAGVALPVYCDGNTPGWRWLGTPGTSASAGYPYTLESIAGKPPIIISGQGSATFPSISSTGGRTLYTVHDAVPTSTAQGVVPARFAGPTYGITRSRLVYSLGRPQGDYYSDNNTRAFTNSFTVSAGRHVGVLTLSDGLTSISADLDGQTQSSSISVSSPFTDESVITYVNAGDSSAVYTIAYPVAHNFETRCRITAWLARQYGAPVPNGY